MSEIRVKSTGTIKLFESDNTSSVTIASPASLSANRTITIPDADVTLGAGVSLSGSTNNTVATVTGANALIGEADLTFDGDSLLVKNGASGGSGANANANELVVENSDHGGISILTPYDKTGAIYFGDGSDDNIGMIEYPHDANCLKFTTNASERMRIDSSGKVGIGENTPLGKLHVKSADSGGSVHADFDDVVVEGSGDAGISILTGSNSRGGINFGDSEDNDIGMINYNHDNNGMFFFTNATQQMCIQPDGDVGIGEANPAGKLEVKGDADTDIARFRTGTDGRQIKMMNASDTQVGGIAINNSDTQYITSSDYRLKENETSITDGITRLKTLKPYRFNFKSEPDRTVDGFFAHEVTAVPEAITGTKDAMHPEVLYTANDELPEGKNIGDVKEETKINPQGIDQSKLVPLLTSALQEAITKIETLETKVTALENA